MNQERQNLYIIINQSRASGRGVLQGILRFAESRPHWRTHLFDADEHGLSETLQALHDGSADGILTTDLETADFATALEHSKIPLVVIGTRERCLPTRTANIRLVSFDEEKIGAFAAQQTLNLGHFKSFGFVGCTDRKRAHLSRLRALGFEDELKRHGLECSTCDCDRSDFLNWLQHLEKPAVVIGCIDDQAASVLNACDRLDIPVPDSLRVIGIDNNEMICQSAYPSLSSIATDFAEEGISAAAELDRMLRSPKAEQKRIALHCRTRCSFVQRMSTSVLAPGLQLVNRALEYISTHADESLTIEEIVNHLHVSKRLLYLRFSEFSDKSLHETIVEHRLNVLKHKLASSRQSICTITSECGFANPTHIKTLFKRRTGLTLGEWRKTHGPSGRRSLRNKVAKPEAKS